MHTVTVIIPTTGSKVRKNSLYQAIQSVLEQSCGNVIPLVVLNGNIYDKLIFKELSENNKIIFKYVEKGSLPNAIFEGRKMVVTEYFSFLDDDDCYTPTCIENKISQFKENNEIDVVIGNGYRVYDKKKSMCLKNINSLNQAPMKELIKYNWLPSCSALFKTKTITLDFFDPEFKYFEWTYLAYKISKLCKLKFIDAITFYINSTESSLSNSEAYILAQPLLYEKLKQLNLPKQICRELQFKKINCYHNISNYYLDIANMKEAWIWHLKTLMHPFGWKFLSYTRKLLVQILKPLVQK